MADTYVSVNKLKEKLEKLKDNDYDYKYNRGITDCLTVLCQMPAADVLEIVKCIDCELSDELGRCPLSYESDFYCRYSKRREEK